MTPISKLIIKIIHIYQICISPIFVSHCRFEITCSQYGIKVIKEFGTLKGIWMILKRISQCHRFTVLKK